MNQQRGYTIVELMVGLTAGLIVLLAITAIVFAASQHRHDLERVSRQVENGRYAMTLLADDLSNAGYFGEFDPRDVVLPATIPDPCSIDAAVLKTAVSVHVQAYAPGATMPACINDLLSGSPVLAIRRVSTCDAGASGCDAVTPGEMYMQASLCETELASSMVAAHYEVAAQVSSGASPFTLTRRDCATPAALRRYVVHLYYLAANNEDGDGVPTLKRATLSGGAFTVEPLVEGIEAINFECAVDTNGDGAPDAMTADPSSFNACAAEACTVENWANVVGVTIHLMARTTEKAFGYSDAKTYAMGLQADGTPLVLGPFGDALKRHVYVSALRFNNVAGRRE